jgi:hypothetical protein
MRHHKRPARAGVANGLVTASQLPRKGRVASRAAPIAAGLASEPTRPRRENDFFRFAAMAAIYDGPSISLPRDLANRAYPTTTLSKYAVPVYEPRPIFPPINELSETLLNTLRPSNHTEMFVPRRVILTAW